MTFDNYNLKQEKVDPIMKQWVHYSKINISALFHRFAIIVQDPESTIQLTVCVRG